MLKTDWKFIVSLNLMDNLITKEGVKVITEREYQNLKTFYIAHNDIGNRGIKYIARARWPKLKQLEISAYVSEKDGLKYLTRCKLDELRLSPYEGTYQSFLDLLKLRCMKIELLDL